MSTLEPVGLDARIASWRDYLSRRRQLSSADVDELESHLRDQVTDLKALGLTEDEAFLVAVKRIGAQDELSSEYAREHSDRLWKQLVKASTDATAPTRLPVVLALAVVAALLVKLPELFGKHLISDGDFYLRNLGLFVLPLLAGYFVWQHKVRPLVAAILAAGFVAMAVFLNLAPFSEGADTLVLASVHLGLAMWLLVGVAYAGADWRSDRGRMDFVRFTGEWLIYYALIALGGMVLVVLTTGVFQAVGRGEQASVVITEWVLPCGAAGAVFVAAWLVEAKQSVVENMAPVLTKVFTPLFTVMLLAFLVALVTQPVLGINRDALIIFALVLIVVFGLLLFTVSARDPLAPPTWSDRLQLALLGSALIVDLYLLYAMIGRLGAFGFTPNRTAALGINLILLVNLAWSLVLLIRFLRGRLTHTALERWQVRYLPVYLLWTLAVGLALPPLFGFH